MSSHFWFLVAKCPVDRPDLVPRRRKSSTVLTSTRAESSNSPKPAGRPKTSCASAPRTSSDTPVLYRRCWGRGLSFGDTDSTSDTVGREAESCTTRLTQYNRPSATGAAGSPNRRLNRPRTRPRTARLRWLRRCSPCPLVCRRSSPTCGSGPEHGSMWQRRRRRTSSWQGCSADGRATIHHAPHQSAVRSGLPLLACFCSAAAVEARARCLVHPSGRGQQEPETSPNREGRTRRTGPTTSLSSGREGTIPRQHVPLPTTPIPPRTIVLASPASYPLTRL
jgi:hypothetical protein